MKSGLFATQINRIVEIASKISIFSEKGSGEIPFSGSELSNWSYEEFWKEAIINYWFDIKFEDDSFLIFQENTPAHGDYRFIFYECPYVPKISFEEFRCSFDDEYTDCPGMLEEEYESIITPKKESVTPIRYEYCEKDFTPSIHPVSHFHFGSNSEMRVGSFHRITPLAFFFFVIRQCYPDLWDRCVLKNEQMTTQAKDVFREMKFLNKKFLGEHLLLEFYLKNGQTMSSDKLQPVSKSSRHRR